MASITFGTRTRFQPNSVKVALEAVAARRVRAACEAVGPQTLQFIAEEAANKTKSPYYRGKGLYSKSLTDASSYDYDVTRQANGARLNIHIVDTSAAFAAKFFSVNFGRRGGYVVLPKGTKMLQWPDRESGAIVKAWVTRPGAFTGVHFYEAGIKRGIALIPGAL